jgi:type I restriction-modification system DNA methylase subunit
MKSFFEKIGFTFGSMQSDIKPSEIIISENKTLTEKLVGKVFSYRSPEHTNTSFYVIAVHLSAIELFEVKRYIWNENKYDLYFITEKLNNEVFTTLYYAKSNPYDDDNKIASFSGYEKDNEELEKIKKWSFNSGTFWLNYCNFLYKVKQRTRIDKKLIEQLRDLKRKLKKELNSLNSDCDEIVQSLIDRTLFIKFLEDNHIINSYFYNYHFPNRFNDCNTNDFGYKTLLKTHDRKNINVLFDKINKLFNSILFKSPEIKEKFLTDNILDFIYDAIRQKDWSTGQLSLFDFRFDVIPIEFISHIYEVFLENSQLKEGIYYTPDKLAQLIIDDTVNEVGTILDPACGSGMFLVLAFRKILELAPSKSKNVAEIIDYKSKLLKEYIFGIEKEKIAWRLSIFSLYLEILKDINPEEIKNYIKLKLEEDLFKPIFPIDFSENILHQNSLETKEDKKAHKDKTFDFILGNPPFFEIKENDVEISFVNEYENVSGDEILKAKNIVGHKQISQAFMLKLKDWAKSDTRFGFVQNSSNFYNKHSENFQKFFFEHYQIENFYELSRVKNILFRKAKESVIVTIFNNKRVENNTINYYPVELGIFSETFDLLIIQEDKKIEIKQQSILNKEIVLRDYLIGNEFDLELIKKLQSNFLLEKYLVKLQGTKGEINNGLQIVGKEQLVDEFNLNEKEYELLNRNERVELSNKFKLKYTSASKTEEFKTPLILPSNLSNFRFSNINTYIGNVSNFQRIRNQIIYSGNKILLNRVGNRVKAVFNTENIYYNFDIYSIFLKNDKLYDLITAILNSQLANYLIDINYRRRSNGSYPKIGHDAIKNIPIPKILDEDLVTEISEISKQLTEGKIKYEGEIKEKLNELIYDLYDLNILEINRIKDFYEPKRNVTKGDLEEYKIALSQTLRLFFVNKPEIEYYQGVNLPFDMVITAIYFNNARENSHGGKKTLQYIINKILQEKSDEKFISLREKIYGNNCIYIVKNNSYHSWSTTKAFEDGQDILQKFGR